MRYLVLLFLVACDLSNNGHLHKTRDDHKIEHQETWQLLLDELAVDGWMLDAPAPGVWWTAEPCDTLPGNCIHTHDGQRLYGVTYSCDQIYVAENPWEIGSTCHTALVHEFGHCARDMLGYSMDGDHSERDWWGAVNRAWRANCEWESGSL